MQVEHGEHEAHVWTLKLKGQKESAHAWSKTGERPSNITQRVPQLRMGRLPSMARGNGAMLPFLVARATVQNLKLALGYTRN